jgi:ADP-ribose pyrophosphatase YjhB (NUDIX family)
MGKAARAIIIEGDKMLLMHRNKEGSQYFTLVGGRANDDETMEQALVREVKEETGLTVTRARLVFIEEHPAPYNEQYTFLCEVAPHESVDIQDDSEEGQMNRVGINMHTPVWSSLNAFKHIPLRTPQLHHAIELALKNGFPAEPIKI